MSRLGEQLRQILDRLSEHRVRTAVIGGLAGVARGLVRATSDVDILVDEADRGTVDATIGELGYSCIHRSDDVANFVRGDQRLDVLYARRPLARAFLAGADRVDTGLGTMPTVSVEALIAFKLQALVNDPRRLRDLDDIRQLLRLHGQRLNRLAMAEHFALFGRGELLDTLWSEVGHE
jgi:hypothetical protein